jgi:hypothetical protein
VCAFLIPEYAWVDFLEKPLLFNLIA